MIVFPFHSLRKNVILDLVSISQITNYEFNASHNMYALLHFECEYINFVERLRFTAFQRCVYWLKLFQIKWFNNYGQPSWKKTIVLFLIGTNRRKTEEKSEMCFSQNSFSRFNQFRSVKIRISFSTWSNVVCFETNSNQHANNYLTWRIKAKESYLTNVL